MSILTPVYGNSINGATYINTISQSATASDGDIITFSIFYYENFAWNTPAWHGLTFTACSGSPLVIYGSSLRVVEFYLKVPTGAGGTFNIVATTVGAGYSAATHVYGVIKSSNNAFPSIPLKSYSTNIYDTTHSPFNPTISNTLASSDIAIASIFTFSSDVSYAATTTSFTPNGTALTSVRNSIRGIQDATVGFNTGTGTVASTFTRTNTTPPNSPMYAMTTMVFGETSYVVSSINGGNPITYGQTGIAAVLTGFASAITSITATYAGGSKSVACTVTGGTTNNPVFTIADRVDGSPWPTDGTTLTFTFSDGTNTASATQIFGKKSGESVQTFSGAVITDSKYIGYRLNADGFTVNGGEFVYLPLTGLIIDVDTGNHGSDAGTFGSWFIPSTGTGAGNSYFYQWTISDAGVISGSSKSLTALGLTAKGLTASGLTASGF